MIKLLRITVNGVSYEVEVEVLGERESGNTLPALSTPQVAPPAAAPTAAPAAASTNEVVSPIAGVTRKINVAIGDMVKQNQPVVVVEAMKMNTNINARSAGKVKEIKIKVGEPIQKGQVLVVLE